MAQAKRGLAAARLVGRRNALAAGLMFAAAAAVFPGSAGAVATAETGGSTAIAQKIADHFSAIRTMEGKFVQFGPTGQQTGGTFYIERPGKLRFNYEPPSNFKVIADGNSVVINNPRLKTWEAFPLSKTPLKLLLDKHIDLTGDEVLSVQSEPDLTTIKLRNKTLFGNSTVTMMFDPKTYDLKQWTITDPRGKNTTVMIFNVQEGVKIDPSLFKIDYSKVIDANQVKRRSQ